MHKARKQNIGEYVITIHNDGEERDKWGQHIAVCGICGCSYKGSKAHMKHKAAMHNINVVWHSYPTCDFRSKLEKQRK